MRRATLRGIMLSMLPRTERTTGVNMSRYSWLVAAVLLVLIVGVATGGKSADATSYDPEELRVLGLINQYRQNNGVGPLILSDTLAVAAGRHSQDMGRYGFFGHDTAASSYYPAGSRPWDRMEAEGYVYNTYKGENIAVGCESADRCFELWRNSPSHNTAMLDGRYRVIGIARVAVPGSVHGWYWTTDFGGALDPTSHAPGESNKPVEDGPGIENGEMNNETVWEQEAKDGAKLILKSGRARLGGYNDGVDDLRQKVRITGDAELSYDLRITTAERRHPFDRLTVRLTDEKGRQLAILGRYTDGDAGGWRRESVNLSSFAGRTVYLSFFVRTDPRLLTTFYIDRVVLEPRDRS